MFIPLIRFASDNPVSVAAVCITEELARRPAGRTDPSRESCSARSGSADGGRVGQVLPVLVDSALEFCDAVASGISIFE